MKLTQSQLLEALRVVGLQDVELVENDSDSEFNEDSFIEAIDKNRGSILRPRLAEELESAAKQKVTGQARYDIIKTVRDITGIERKQLEAIDNINDIIKLAVDHTKGLSQGSQDEVRREIDDILERHNVEKDNLVKEWESKYNDLNTRYIDRDITSVLKSSLKNAPLMQTADKDILAADFKQHLANKYHMTFDEANKAVAFFKKDNPTMPALDGNKHIDMMKEAQDFFSPRGQWVTDMRNEVPKIPNGQPYQQTTPPNPMGQPKSVEALNAAIKQHIASKVPSV